MFIHRRNGEAPNNRRLRVGESPDIREKKRIDRVEIFIPDLEMQMSIAGAAFSAVRDHVPFSNGILPWLEFHFDGEFDLLQLFCPNGEFEFILKSAKVSVRCIESVSVPEH